MAYFNDERSSIRLYLLYVLKIFGRSMTETQLMTALIEALGIQYFDIEIAKTELEDAGLIASVPSQEDVSLSLTPGGNEKLMLTVRNMPKSVKEKLDNYIRENHERLHTLSLYRSHVRKNHSGGYDVSLISYDNNKILMSVMVNVPDKNIADDMCRKWQENAPEVYKLIYDKLI